MLEKGEQVSREKGEKGEQVVPRLVFEKGAH